MQRDVQVRLLGRVFRLTVPGAQPRGRRLLLSKHFLAYDGRHSEALRPRRASPSPGQLPTHA